MKIAVPTANGLLNPHFGHCDGFEIFDVNDSTIVGKTKITAPPHEPGLLPKWLGEKGVNIVIAGGMGHRAQQLFEEQGIKVVVGASSKKAEDLIKEYCSGTLVSGENACDH